MYVQAPLKISSTEWTPCENITITILLYTFLLALITFHNTDSKFRNVCEAV